jgi:PTH1 family peptidyl-tRNA hydrolase
MVKKGANNMKIDIISGFLGAGKTTLIKRLLKTNLKNEKVILLKPQTYMNLSGESVRKVMDFYKIDVNDILVISDDLDLPIGNYRLKYKGSCGGHNGLRNIEQHVQTQEYKRLKIGISKDDEIDTKDYVLGKLSRKDKKVLEEMVPTINSILDDFLDTDFEVLMSKYNHK